MSNSDDFFNQFLNILVDSDPDIGDSYLDLINDIPSTKDSDKANKRIASHIITRFTIIYINSDEQYLGEFLFNTREEAIEFLTIEKKYIREDSKFVKQLHGGIELEAYIHPLVELRKAKEKKL